MRNLTRLACCGAALALMPGVTADVRAGKPGNDQPKTQACTLTGDAEGTGRVGIDAKSYGPLTMTVKNGPLAIVFDTLGVATYSGQGRVLKSQGRLDFHFDIPGSECRPIAYGEEPGPNLPEGVCRYHLLLLNGVYNRKANEVEYQAPTAEAQLFDYTIPVGSGTLIGEGSANLMVLF